MLCKSCREEIENETDVIYIYFGSFSRDCKDVLAHYCDPYIFHSACFVRVAGVDYHPHPANPDDFAKNEARSSQTRTTWKENNE